MSYVTAVYRTVVDDVIQKVKDDFIQEGYESVLVELQTLWETKLMQTGALNINPGPQDPLPPGSGGYALDPFAGQGAQGGLLQGGEYVGDGYLPAQGGQQFDSVLGRPQRFMPQTWAGQDPGGASGERAAANPYNAPDPATGGGAGGVQGPPGEGGGLFTGLLADGGEHQANGGEADVGGNVLGKRKAPEADGPGGGGASGASIAPVGLGLPGAGEPPPTLLPVDDLGFPGAGPSEPAPGVVAGAPATTGSAGVGGGDGKEVEALGLDDIGDDDDEEPDAKDIVLAQFEKVTRSKNKWKCTLLDGIMHVNGRDYLFQKAQGEFQW